MGPARAADPATEMLYSFYSYTFGSKIRRLSQLLFVGSFLFSGCDCPSACFVGTFVVSGSPPLGCFCPGSVSSLSTTLQIAVTAFPSRAPIARRASATSVKRFTATALSGGACSAPRTPKCD